MQLAYCDSIGHSVVYCTTSCLIVTFKQNDYLMKDTIETLVITFIASAMFIVGALFLA